METNKTPIRWQRFIGLAAILWFLQGAYSTLNTSLIQQYSGLEVRLLAITIYSFSSALVWFLFTPLILRLIIWVDERFVKWYKILIALIVVAPFLSSLQRLLDIFLTYSLIKWTAAIDLSLLHLDNFFGLNFWRQVANGIVIYFVITGIIYAYLFYRRNQMIRLERSRLQAELASVKLENLTYQLQPHFLFNSLQSVSTLMHRDLDTADQALADLSDLLRHSIQNIGKDHISLGEELLYLQKYVDLQQTRYQGKFSAQIKFDQDILEEKVPAFLLQPLVENSIKHGVESSGNSIQVQIEAIKNGNTIEISCRDNGRLKAQKTKVREGIGIKNLQLRLKALYADRAELAFGPTAEGFQTIMQIPLDKS